MKTENFWHKTLVLLSLLLFLQIIGPFVKPGLFLGHDSQLHLIYLRHFEDAARSGQIPVRFIDWFIPGLNQPLFNFYQPGVDYLFLIPRFLGFPYTISLKIIVVFLWFISALLMYAFAKRHFGTLGAILAAYFYLIAPYHVLDIFIRAALPEFAALAFTPGIFWAIRSYCDTRRSIYLALISLFIALVTISHPPTMIMYSPFLLLYLLFLLYLRKSLSFLWPILIAILIGFGLISFFLVPAFFEQKYVQTIYMRSGYYDFHSHFVCFTQLFSTFWGHGTSRIGCMDGLSFQLGIVHWFVIGLAIFMLIVRFTTKKDLPTTIINTYNLKKTDYLLLIICVVSVILYLYMTLAISQPIWENLPYIFYIQYPWRFLAPTIFVASFIAGSTLLIFKGSLYRRLVFALLMLSATFAYGGYLKPIAYAQPDEINFGKEILHETISGIKNLNPELGYMPKWTQVLPPEDGRPRSEVKIATDEARIDEAKLTAAHKSYTFDVQKPTIARFYTHYFPGWQVKLDGQNVDPNLDNIYGYMDIQLPQGKHQVELIFKNTPARSIANTLTINFLLIAIAQIFLFQKKPTEIHKT